MRQLRNFCMGVNEMTKNKIDKEIYIEEVMLVVMAIIATIGIVIESTYIFSLGLLGVLISVTLIITDMLDKINENILELNGEKK